MIANKGKRINYISLFSGCGGFDIGFLQNGFHCLGAYDLDAAVIDVYKKNIDAKAHVHDLLDHNLPGELPTKINLVVAGSPCQGFSTMGKRKINDPRNSLLLTGGEIAIKYNSDLFVCENVLGSLSGRHNKYWKKLIKLLQSNGYRTKMIKYCASSFGIPQTRKRLILYAWKGGELTDDLFINKKPVHSVLSSVFNEMGAAANHNLNYIEKGSSDYLIAKSIKQGQKLCNVRNSDRSIHTWDIPKVFGDVSDEEKKVLLLIMKLRRQIRRRVNGDADPVDEKFIKDYFGVESSKMINSLIDRNYLKRVERKYIDLTNTFNGKFRRLDIKTLSPTVDTRFGSYRYFLHPIENRGISVREAARIQGFPDSFVFHGSLNKQYEMIGNAVPPPMSFFIASIVKEIIIPAL